MKEHISASEAAAEVAMANVKAATEIAAATAEFTAAATEMAAATAGVTAAAAEDMANFYIESTKRFIKMFNDKRKEAQSTSGSSN